MANGGHLENKKITITQKRFGRAHQLFKNQMFKNPRWWTAAILKIVKCDISATVWPILTIFV